ncbi:MAG: hypothetical protein IH606_09485 [Burkholderiales bacterium]|nr:hypothetical protein [Burkholderiales bacterium]
MEKDDARGGMTVHFMDGKKMRFVWPKQATDNYDLLRKTQLVLDRPYLCFETDTGTVVIPMANVKFIETAPRPASVPEFFFKNVRVVED